MNECIQCGHEATSKFCQNCGQRQNVPRLTVRTFFEDFLSRIYGLDGAMPRTIIGLTKYPGVVVQEYVKGIRGKYVGPVGYYFLMFAVYLLTFEITGVTLQDYTEIEGINELLGAEQDVVKEITPRQKLFRDSIFNNIQFFIILSFPFMALWGMVFFKKSGYNFMENMVLAFYTQAHITLLNMFDVCIYAATGEQNRTIMSAIATIYFGIAASQFYINKVTLGGVMKAITVFSISFVCYLIVGALVGGLILGIYMD